MKTLYKKYLKNNERGQGSVEFMVVSMLFIMLIIFHITLAIVYMSTMYVDYALFMSARAGQSAHEDQARQKEVAYSTLTQYIRNDSTPPPPGSINLPANEMLIDPFVKVIPSTVLGDPVEPYNSMDGAFRGVGEVPGSGRVWRVAWEFSYQFLIGSVFSSGFSGELTSTNRPRSTIFHIYRREPTMLEVNTQFQNQVGANLWTGSGDIEEQVFIDNGS